MYELSTMTVEMDGHIAWVSFNRPEKRNAMTLEFFLEMIDLFPRLDYDPQVRVVVIKGEGKSFTAGIDLTSLASLIQSDDAGAREELRHTIVRGQESATVLERCRKPVIAAVHGACVGGGVDVICACDIRLASRDAYFSVRETRLAVVADVGTLQRLPYVVGHSWARELALTGRDVSADEARAMNLVTHLTDDRESLYTKAREIALEIAANSPLAVMGVKDTMLFSRENGVKAGLEYVAQKNAAVLKSEDLMEAMTAFMEKRPPEFKGR